MLLAAMVYLLVTLVFGQFAISKQERQLDIMKRQITLKKGEINEMKRLMSGSAEGDYLEKIARERLSYASPDERVFIDMSGR